MGTKLREVVAGVLRTTPVLPYGEMARIARDQGVSRERIRQLVRSLRPQTIIELAAPKLCAVCKKPLMKHGKVVTEKYWESHVNPNHRSAGTHLNCYRKQRQQRSVKVKCGWCKRVLVRDPIGLRVQRENGKLKHGLSFCNKSHRSKWTLKNVIWG